MNQWTLQSRWDRALVRYMHLKGRTTPGRTSHYRDAGFLKQLCLCQHEIRMYPTKVTCADPGPYWRARCNDTTKFKALQVYFRFMGYDTRLVTAPMTDDMQMATTNQCSRTTGQADEQCAACSAQSGGPWRGSEGPSAALAPCKIPCLITALPDPMPMAAEQSHIWTASADWPGLGGSHPALTSNSLEPKRLSGEILMIP